MTHADRREQLHVFAVYMVGARDEAFAAVREVTAQQPAAPERWLAGLVRLLLVRPSPGRAERFAALDDLLRAETTEPIDLRHPLVQGDVRRLSVLLSELRRSCLLGTLQGLDPERRAVFILRHVLGLSIETCAALCDTTTSVMTASDARGRRALDGYLGARCEHINPGNPCRCAARLGTALDRGVVQWAEHHEHDGAALPRKTYRKVRDLYASLPRVRLPIVE
jgi:DNA-directed RNA polymerase specialized sigma24 family protein